MCTIIGFLFLYSRVEISIENRFMCRTHSSPIKNRIILFVCMLDGQKLWLCCDFVIHKPIQRHADTSIWKQMHAIVRFV